MARGRGPDRHVDAGVGTQVEVDRLTDHDRVAVEEDENLVVEGRLGVVADEDLVADGIVGEFEVQRLVVMRHAEVVEGLAGRFANTYVQSGAERVDGGSAMAAGEGADRPDEEHGHRLEGARLDTGEEGDQRSCSLASGHW